MSRPDALRATFPRSRRLKRQRLIRTLFDRRRGDVGVVRAGALLARYRIASPDEVGMQTPLQVGFATGRHIGTKPARNRVKRLLRESFRVHQHALVDLFSDRDATLTLMLLYRGRTEEACPAIRDRLPDLLNRLAERLASPEASASDDPAGA